MSPELGEYYPYPKNVETVHSPVRQDETHRLPFLETEQEFQKAGARIKRIWQTFLEANICNFIMIAEITGKPEYVEIVEEDGTSTVYGVESEGTKVDHFGQVLDTFRFARFDQGQSPKAAFIIVGTKQTERSRFKHLVSLSVEDEEKDITQLQFHFVNDKLLAIHQVVQPEVLFPTPYETSEKQFFSVSFAQTRDRTAFLRVVAGFQYDKAVNFNWYKNYGGSIIASQKLRVIDGEVELVEIRGKDIFTTPPFPLPHAIANMANFEPASAFF